MAKQNFKTTEGSPITLDQAYQFTQAYRNSPLYQSLGGVNAFFYGKTHIQKILDQPNCQGLRIYYGVEKDENGQEKSNLVLIGTSREGTDLIDGYVCEAGLPCPPFCDTMGLFNSKAINETFKKIGLINPATKQDFNGAEGEQISYELACEYTENHRNNELYQQLNGINAWFCGRDHIQSIIDQESCMGLRIYYGLEKVAENKLKPNVVLVGTNKAGTDLLDGFVCDNLKPCPPFCNNFGLFNSKATNDMRLKVVTQPEKLVK